MNETDIELSDRERAVAKNAAKLAVAEMAEEFYKQVGRTIVNRFLVIVGIAAIAFAYGKGWIRL